MQKQTNRRMHMDLKILLPSEVFAQIADVTRIVAEAQNGSFGLLPNRLDCAAALAPGILTYRTQDGGEVFIAVDQGILVKSGPDVVVSVRRALRGADLGQLRQMVEQTFLAQDAAERSVRRVMAKLETGFLSRFAALHHER